MTVDITDFEDITDYDEDPDIIELSITLKKLKKIKRGSPNIGNFEKEEKDRRRKIKLAIFGKLPQQQINTLEILLSYDCYKGARSSFKPQDVTIDATRRTALHYVLTPTIGGRLTQQEEDFCSFAALTEVLELCPDPRILDMYGKTAFDYCDDQETIDFVMYALEQKRPDIYRDCVNFFKYR